MKILRNDHKTRDKTRCSLTGMLFRCLNFVIDVIKAKFRGPNRDDTTSSSIPSYNDHGAIFPCSTLHDEEVRSLFAPDTIILCRSTQLPLEEEDRIVSAESCDCSMPNGSDDDDTILFDPDDDCSTFCGDKVEQPYIDIRPHRLIDTHTLELVKPAESSVIPPYAILSHRWILGQEIVYEEFLRPHAQTISKLGYQKIQAACQQARQDGIHYIWVDTCCIEQGNHEDVAASITSMYTYYQNAEVCYVYLADVIEKSGMFGQKEWGWIEGGSEWFNRGWTLQELLAPPVVIFFNKNWQRLGDKHELREEIFRQTTIPPTVLSGEQSVKDVDVVTRMSWATERITTREQDEAYCLQGILGVTVEPNYEESPFASINRLAKALFDVEPELKERLGISDDLFRDPNSDFLWNQLFQRRYDVQKTF